MKIEFETYVIFVSFITSFFAVFLSNGIIIGVPAIAQDFAMNNVIQNWVPTIFFLVVAVFTVPAGQISGKFGVKKSLLAGITVFLLGSIGACLAFSTESFLIFRIIQGAGVAFLNVSAMAMVVHAVKPQNRGKALGFTVTGVYLATSLSPVICGFLVHNLGWRAMFYFVIPFLVLCIILLILKIPQEWKTYQHDTIDKVGSIIYAIGILLFIYGFTTLITTNGKILTVTGIILLVIFGAYELRQKSPVFNMNLFKNKKFTSSNIAALCSYLAIMVVTTILNYHLQYVRGWDAQMSGMILIITPIIMAIMAPNAGKLSDKIHPQKLAATGMAIATIALGILTFLNGETPIYFVIIAMILQGIGMGLFSSPNMNAIMSSVPPKDAPTASASQATMRTIGQTMSLGLLTLVFAWIMGNLELSPQYTTMIIQASQTICGICTAACILAIFASLIGIKSSDKFNTGR
ncbi:Major Facilitator Superfamily protein [Methanobrevibacter gottschalkii]|uniref:MFS transporter n=2 Tax=Methanobrevibacter gottschalkii TaxID=190974 RepID=A0A3N5B0W9_9EURY|nr:MULTISPECIES: MFS transporter [Methanobrevibacter]MCQ2970552.1 MFS transporter [archaeon]OED01708.1 MFS transporter [Methanobrevibacter sp. A27]RPF50984.1 MFS transporter [Methanobrevibacter gottschalkii DSM 11977]SEL08838.1 Major Facilitator Superfamily protein [Methanobrevibacter gottschalkii]